MTRKSAPKKLIRTTITYGPDLDAIVKPRQRDDTDRSATIARLVTRYAAVCERELPELSEAEWNLLRVSLNGVWHGEAWSIVALPHGVADSISLDKLDVKWEVDGPALVRRLDAMGYGQRLAVVDAVERWWAKKEPITARSTHAT